LAWHRRIISPALLIINYTEGGLLSEASTMNHLVIARCMRKRFML